MYRFPSNSSLFPCTPAHHPPAGQLRLGALCERLGPASRLPQLSSVYLAGGGEDWGLLECVHALEQLPTPLERLQIKFPR